MCPAPLSTRASICRAAITSDNRDALRVAVDALREQLERERGRADRLEWARDAELEATANAEAQREYECGRVDQAR
jgi:uncharacterized membrane protein